MRKIQIHWSFVIAAVIMILIGWAKVFFMFVLFVTLHETTHMAVVKLFGGKLIGLRLTAIGEAAVIDGLEEMSAPRRCAVFLSGPAMNIFIALLFYVFGWRNVSQINFLIGFFNLLPVFPLDGGRAAQQFLSGKMGTLRGNLLLTRVSRLVGYAIILAGVFYAVLYPSNISLLCVGIYIRQWNKRTIYTLTLDFFMLMSRKREIKKSVMPVRLLAAYSNTTLRYIVERLDWDHLTHVMVDNRPGNILAEATIMAYVLENGMNGTVNDITEA